MYSSNLVDSNRTAVGLCDKLLFFEWRKKKKCCAIWNESFGNNAIKSACLHCGFYRTKRTTTNECIWNSFACELRFPFELKLRESNECSAAVQFVHCTKRSFNEFRRETLDNTFFQRHSHRRRAPSFLNWTNKFDFQAKKKQFIWLSLGLFNGGKKSQNRLGFGIHKRFGFENSRSNLWIDFLELKFFNRHFLNNTWGPNIFSSTFLHWNFWIDSFEPTLSNRLFWIDSFESKFDLRWQLKIWIEETILNQKRF